MEEKDALLLCLMGLSITLYSLAAVSHAWFILPPHSFYGLWYVKFCDYLQCQIIPAFYSEEPGWYHCMQLLSVVGWLGLVMALFMLLCPRYLERKLPSFVVFHWLGVISAICLVSAAAILTSLVVFYSNLCESSGICPLISWCSVLAAISCVGELCVAFLVMK